MAAPRRSDFIHLGTARDDWKRLADDLMAIARNCDEFATELTPLGIKYKATGSVGRRNHRLGNVLTVWIVENDDPPRLVTAYPHEIK